MDDEIKIMAEQLMKSRPDDESLLEDLRLQDIEDRIMGRSRPYKRGERMLRLLDPTMDPLTGERDVKGFARQMVTNVAPPGALQRHNPLMNLIREANRLSKAYHGQDYVKELKERIDQAGTPVNLKDFEPKFQEGGSSKNDLTFFGGSMKPPGTPEHEKLQADTLGIIKQMDDASVMATASRMTGLPFSTPTQARLVLEQMLGGGSISAGVSGTGRVLPERVSGYDIGAKFPALGGQMSVGATIPRGEGSPIVNVGYRRQFQEGGLVEDTDKIVDQLVAGGMDPEQAMILALRMAQSRQQSILGGVEPPTSDVPPVQEPILGGDTSKLFQRDPTLLERAKQLPADVVGAGEALASFGSAAALMPASMLYALRPGQKTQGNPLEFMQRNMYIPRTESGARHLQGLGELLENLPQTGPLPELQAFTGIGKGVGRQLQQKGKEAAQSLAPAAANVAEDLLSRQGLLVRVVPEGDGVKTPHEGLVDKEWFGESKVVNDRGQPQIVYRGQPKGQSSVGDVSRSEIGGAGFFTNSQDVAKLYAGLADSERKGLTNYSTGRNGEVGEYYLSIKKPWDPDSINNKEGNKWLHAGAREEMGDRYETANNNERIDSGWDYFVSKYGLPEEVAEGDISLKEWRQQNDFYDYINEVVAPKVIGQNYSSEFVGRTKHGALLILEPKLFKGIRERNGYDGIIYSDPEHPGTTTLVPFDESQIKPIGVLQKKEKFKQGGHVKAVESARRAIMKAMGGSVKAA